MSFNDNVVMNPLLYGLEAIGVEESDIIDIIGELSEGADSSIKFESEFINNGINKHSPNGNNDFIKDLIMEQGSDTRS